jgi:hypothetical protein
MLRALMADRRGRTSIRAAARFLAVAVVLAVVLAACSSTPSPTPAPPTPSPAVTGSPSIGASLAPPSIAPIPSAPADTQPSGAAQCEPADIKASHGRVEGAAGSTFTTVVLSPAFPCSIDLFPAFGLRDANGAILVGGTAGGSGRLNLDPELTYETNVRLANWCADDPVFPLRFELILGGGATEAVTGGSFPEDGDVPPCNGAGAGRILEAGQWEAAAP